MKSYKVVVGIDVGKKGGLTRLTETTQEAIVMPLLGSEIDAFAIAQWLKELRPDFVVVEKVGARPKQGVVSMFNFGRSTGEVIGVLKTLAIPYQEVTPQMWKSKVLAGTAKDKDAAINYVAARYPDLNLVPPRCRKAHDGIADATCMAVYAQEIL